MIALILSSTVSSSSPSSAPVKAAFKAAAALPPWLECASSMMIAKRRSRCCAPMSSRMNGNFWTVVMMIFLPSAMKRAEVAGMLGVADGRADLRELLDGVADLLIENPPVGDHDHRVEHLAVAIARADQLVRQPGDRVRLAGARRVLDQLRAARRPSSAASASSLRTTSSWWKRGNSLVALLLAGLLVLAARRSGRSSR